MTDAKKTTSKRASTKAEEPATRPAQESDDAEVPDEPFPSTADLNPAFTVVEDEPDDDDSDDD